MLRVGNEIPFPEPGYFSQVFYLSEFADVCTRQDLETVLRRAAPKSAEGYLSCVESRCAEAVQNGAVAFKIGRTARRRPLDFVPHPMKETDNAYKFLLKNKKEWDRPGVTERLRPLVDAVYWKCFSVARETDTPVQVHSGLEFPQPWDGRPATFIPSLVEFPEVRFAIFHGSYPYMAELTGLAKAFPNVYLDLAWLHLISRGETRSWLNEWLDVLPANKVFLFGGDCFTFFGTCSHLEMAIENLGWVLAEKIRAGFCSKEEAVVFGKKLLYDNARACFNLKIPS